MSQTNRVSATLTSEAKTNIKNAIKTIADNLPFLISLTDDERRGGMKLGDKTVGFLDKNFNYTQTNTALVPAYLDVAEYGKDYTVTKDLLEILQALHPLVQSIEDTYTQAGIEALSAALVFYNAVKMAAKQGVPGAKAIYDDLQKRFPGGSGSANATTQTASV
jgi:hypothetical protein